MGKGMGARRIFANDCIGQRYKVHRRLLVGDVVEDIDMEQPKGFKVGTKEEDLVCLIRKSLNGLKQ